MYLIFDTETTGLPKNFKAPLTDTENWPRCIQIAWQLHDEMGNCIEHKDYLVKPEGFSIPFQSEQIHGISTELATQEGESLEFVLKEFKEVLSKSKFVVGQNVKFDLNVMGSEFFRTFDEDLNTELSSKIEWRADGKEKTSDEVLTDFKVSINTEENDFSDLGVLDTMTEKTATLCQLPGGRGGKFKLPNLTELHQYLFGTPFSEAHNATADVEATTRCFFELLRKNNYSESELNNDEGYLSKYKESNPDVTKTLGLKHRNLAEASKKLKRKSESSSPINRDSVDLKALEDVSFSHLHNHTQYSILQSTTTVYDLIASAAKYKMPAVSLTDSGNMMAAFHFVTAASKHNKSVKGKIKEIEESEDVDAEKIAELKQQFVKPIVGCELNVCKNRNDKSVKDNGFQVPFLAKNIKGYHNLAKLSSAAYVEGFYYVPRIDKTIIEELKGDIIVLTGGVTGEIPGKILNEGEEKAEEAFVWWKEQFGDDFYVEINRHGTQEEDVVNEVLLRFSKKYNVKCIASNNTHYINKSDAVSHDLLLCVRDGEKKSTPKGRGRGFRYAFPNDEFYFKSQDEMKELFSDLPETIKNTNEIVDKIEPFELARDVLLPEFEIPEEFQDPLDDENPKLKIGENNYLRHLTYEGAKERYTEITPEIEERLDFELETIRKTGYPGYFLITQDFIAKAREMDVSVGPGRGSAAGSAVAYCTGITNVDPIEYDLLFERFLNPDRVSMPDIDIDFDDEGRGRVIQYVIDKYGASQVAQIITYGTMAAKSSIRDAGRVMDLPLPDTDRIAKLVPDMKLNKLFAIPKEKLSEKLNSEQMVMAEELMKINEQKDLEGEVLRQAIAVEGSLRNTGIHACGVIITPSDIREYVPVALAKDSGMYSTQFDNSVVEDAGLLKMDFLGLKTLTLIKDTLKIVKARHRVEIDIEAIPKDDTATYELFQRGETVGIFQYESPGMQKHMKSLKPTVFADLIAMNALYRPGPIEYIPSFIKRKLGEEEIVYDLDACEEYLKETYGITVYQEQVMLLSQKLAGFSKGDADVLRKAMGKKIFALLEKLKPQFLDGGEANGHSRDTLEKIWKDWEAFASYAFNKSHSTCYAWIAYQTAYLKAHYPAEYMAAVLSNNMNDIKQVTFFMEECKRMGLEVLGPDVNESYHKFAVNKEGAVRFGMGAIKGVGANAVASIVDERKANGEYKDVFDFITRIDLRSANKKTIEGLALGGGFDLFEIYRSQFFEPNDKGVTFIEGLIKFGNAVKSQADAPPDLFGGDVTVELNQPVPVEVEKWPTLQKLSKEKEVVGVYISGHPLDDFKLEATSFGKGSVSLLNQDLSRLVNKELKLSVIVTEVEHRISKNGNPFGTLMVEDYNDSFKFFIFGEDYLKNKHFMVDGNFLFITGKVQPKRFAKTPQDIEFKISNIELLTELRSKKAKRLNLTFNVEDVSENFIQDLHQLLAENEGSCPVKVNVRDELNRIDVNLTSQMKGVELSDKFIQEIEAIEQIEYKVS